VSDAAFSGVCAVSRSGRIAQRAGGLADRAAGRPWTPDTRSQVASISKQFVAAVALILAGRGALGVDDPVSRQLPAAGAAWDDVSIRQLLTHTSGMSHWGEQPGFVAATPTPAEERLRLFLAAPRPAPDEFRYSSPGYVVLSAVVAAAGGRPYEELARELVIEPLGMDATRLGSADGGPAALGYRAGERVAPWDLGSMPGTGDVWSTAADLARFVSALHTGGLLPAAVQPLLHDVRVPRSDSSDSRIRAHAYAAGHFVGTVDGRPACLHPGDNPGYQSLAVWLPEATTTVVVLSNDEADEIESVVADAVGESVD
jgi:CubicO group peptidase (beta-lactamase class C family)